MRRIWITLPASSLYVCVCWWDAFWVWENGNESKWQTSSECLDAKKKHIEYYLCSAPGNEMEHWGRININVSVAERVMRTSIKLAMLCQFFMRFCSRQAKERRQEGKQLNLVLWPLMPFQMRPIVRNGSKIYYILRRTEEHIGTRQNDSGHIQKLCESQKNNMMKKKGIVGHKMAI